MAQATRQPKSTLATITESLSSSVKVDREAGVIRGVKLIGFESKNGRYYPPAVLKSAVSVYEGSKVNIDHPEKEPTQARKYGERFGVIRNVHHKEGQGNFGDCHFNPKHRLAEQVCWDAEHNPEALGFSHNALLRVGSPKGGKEMVEEILSIRSMDLVADPATTKSLFESEEVINMDPEVTPTPSDTDPKTAMKGAFRQMIMAAVDDESLDMKATMKKIAEIMKAQEKLMGGGASSTPVDEKDDAEESVQFKNQLALLTEQLNQYKAREAQTQRTEAIHKELAAAGLDAKNPRHVSELFSKQLSAIESVQDREALIKDRAALVGSTKPLPSFTGTPVYQPQTTNTLEQMDAKTFASRLKS